MTSLPSKYKALLTSDKRYYIITGGRSSGKSFCINTWLVLLTHFEPGHRVLHTRFTGVSTKDSIIADIKARIEMLGLQDEYCYYAESNYS